MSARSNNIPVSGLVLQEKATDFAKTLGIADFKASNGWIDRWKTRNNVTFKTVSGEAKSCTPEMTAHWKETHLPTILSRYKLKDIFNADEFGLFFQALPNKTLELKGEKCTGGKHNKVRLAGMSVASATTACHWKKQQPKLFQGTGKKFDGLRDVHRFDQTAGSKISSQES